MNFNYERTENGMNVGKGILAKEVLSWAKANYDNGGHWIYDKMEADVIEYTFATLEEAQEYCQLLNGLNKEVNSW
jgi:hypothetical protein